MELKKIITDPATVAVTVAGALSHLLGLGIADAIVHVVWANVPTLFTALSVSGFTLAPRVEWLPAEPLTAAAIAVGGLYVLRLLNRVWNDFKNET
jgi:hypothetical protein